MQHDTQRILTAIQSEQWLITDEWYDRIVEIASRENTLTPEMISKFEGMRNGREYMVTMYDDTAVLDIQGPVFRYANLFTMFSGATSTETVSSELARLGRDNSVARVIVRFDTPGGVASGAAETSTQFQQFEKPLVSFATGMCCSLGYFWASQGSQLIVAEDAMVGNIGTRTRAPEERTDADMSSKGAPRKLLNRGDVQNVLDALEDVFVAHVAQGRGVSAEHVREHFGQGGVFIGQQAVTAGLADRTGTLDSILGGSFGSTRISTAKQIGSESTMQNQTGSVGAIEETDPDAGWAELRAKQESSSQETANLINPFNTDSVLINEDPDAGWAALRSQNEIQNTHTDSDDVLDDETTKSVDGWAAIHELTG